MSDRLLTEDQLEEMDQYPSFEPSDEQIAEYEKDKAIWTQIYNIRNALSILEVQIFQKRETTSPPQSEPVADAVVTNLSTDGESEDLAYLKALADVE